MPPPLPFEPFATLAFKRFNAKGARGAKPEGVLAVAQSMF
jgi:hypothetical protein